MSILAKLNPFSRIRKIEAEVANLQEVQVEENNQRLIELQELQSLLNVKIEELAIASSGVAKNIEESERRWKQALEDNVRLSAKQTLESEHSIGNLLSELRRELGLEQQKIERLDQEFTSACAQQASREKKEEILGVQIVERDKRHQIQLAAFQKQLEASTRAVVENRQRQELLLGQLTERLENREVQLKDREKQYELHLAALNKQIQSREAAFQKQLEATARAAAEDRKRQELLVGHITERLENREVQLKDREKQYELHLGTMLKQLESAQKQNVLQSKVTDNALKRVEDQTGKTAAISKTLESESRLRTADLAKKWDLFEVAQTSEIKSLKEQIKIGKAETDGANRLFFEKTQATVQGFTAKLNEHEIKNAALAKQRDLQVGALNKQLEGHQKSNSLFGKLLDSTNREYKLNLERYQNSLNDLKKLAGSPAFKEQASRNELMFRSMFPADEWLFKQHGIYEGETCYLLGCGPSLANFDVGLLKDKFVMASNGSALIKGLNPTFFITVAKEWWKQYSQEVAELKVEHSFLADYVGVEELASPVTYLNGLEFEDYRDLDVDEPWFFSEQAAKHVVFGGTVIFPALQVLYWLGFKRVVLLGVDHNYDRKKVASSGRGVYLSGDAFPHFSEKYYKRDVSVHCDIRAMERGYELSRRAFENSGREIINATKGTKLKSFKRMNIASLL